MITPILAVSGSAFRRCDLVAVHAGHHDVHDDEVGLHGARHFQPLVAVQGDLDLEPIRKAGFRVNSALAEIPDGNTT